MLRRAALVCLSLALTAPAAAQPEPAPATAPDPARATYDQAFAALVAGDLATARAGFATVAATAGDPELRAAARELTRLADELAARHARIVGGTPAETPAAPAALEDPDEGRTAIVAMTTLAALYAGVVIVDLSDTSDARVGTGIITGATGLGFAASLYGTRGRTIGSGAANAYSVGLLLGAGNALLLADPLGAETSEQWQVGVLSGMAVTGAAGFVYGQLLRPTSGQISFAGNLATLGIASAGLGLVAIRPDVTSDTMLYTLTAGLDAGAAAGLVLGGELTWSPGRARLVWLGSLVGGLAGLAGGVLIVGTDPGDDGARLVASTTFAGMWGGFGAAAYFTRTMAPDPRYRSAGAQVVPIALERGAGLAIAGQL